MSETNKLRELTTSTSAAVLEAIKNRKVTTASSEPDKKMDWELVKQTSLQPSHSLAKVNDESDMEPFVPDRVAMTAFTSHIIEKCEIIPPELKQVVSNVTMQMFDRFGALATKLVTEEIQELQPEELLAMFVKNNNNHSISDGSPRTLLMDSYTDEATTPQETLMLGEFGEKGTAIKSDMGKVAYTTGWEKLVNDLLQMISRITHMIADPKNDQKNHVFNGASKDNNGNADGNKDDDNEDGDKNMTRSRLKKKVVYVSVFCFTAYICCSVVVSEVKNHYGGDTNFSDRHFSESFKDSACSYANGSNFA